MDRVLIYQTIAQFLQRTGPVAKWQGAWLRTKRLQVRSLPGSFFWRFHLLFFFLFLSFFLFLFFFRSSIFSFFKIRIIQLLLHFHSPWSHFSSTLLRDFLVWISRAANTTGLFLFSSSDFSFVCPPVEEYSMLLVSFSRQHPFCPFIFFNSSVCPSPFSRVVYSRSVTFSRIFCFFRLPPAPFPHVARFSGTAGRRV